MLGFQAVNTSAIHLNVTDTLHKTGLQGGLAESSARHRLAESSASAPSSGLACEDEIGFSSQYWDEIILVLGMKQAESCTESNCVARRGAKSAKNCQLFDPRSPPWQLVGRLRQIILR